MKRPLQIGEPVRYVRDARVYHVRKELRRGFYRCEGAPPPGRLAPIFIEAHASELTPVAE